jgi:hypothetical protein
MRASLRFAGFIAKRHVAPALVLALLAAPAAAHPGRWTPPSSSWWTVAILRTSGYDRFSPVLMGSMSPVGSRAASSEAAGTTISSWCDC